jgi:hypothetical protein
MRRTRLESVHAVRVLVAYALAVTSFLAGSAVAARAAQTPASADELAAITARGRALAAYDAAAMHASKAVRALADADVNRLELYIAQKTQAGWTVDFGRLDVETTSFDTSYEAQSNDGVTFTVQAFTTPRSDGGYLLAAALAIRAAEAQFQPAAGYTYNVAVLPKPDGKLFVYLYPGQTLEDVYPVGGDERFTVSADGVTILEAHRMHSLVLAPTPASPPPGEKVAAGFRTVVVDDVPQDTDVFHVLVRKPPLADMIDARGHLYLIHTDGTIEDKGTTDGHH